MQSLLDFLSGKKTYILCAAAFIYGGGISIGLWSHYPFLDAALASGTLAALRAGVAKVPTPAATPK